MVRCRLRAGASPSFRSSLLPAAPSAVPSAAAAAAGARAPSLAAAGAGAGAAAAAAPPLLALALRRGRPQASKSSRASRPVSSTVGSARHASSVSCLFGLGGGASSVAAVDIKKGQLPVFLSSSPLGPADQTHKHAHQHQPFPPCARLALVRICSRSAPASACFRLWISLFTGWRGCVWVSQQKSPTRPQASSTYETIALNLGCGRGVMVSV